MKTQTQSIHIEHSLIYNATIIFVASILIGISSQLSIPIPFSPVPVSLQPHAVLLTAAMLGGPRAFAAVGLFLLEGVSGLPVFALGHFGLPILLGTTGGYLMSYLLVAVVVGFLYQHFSPKSFWSHFGILSLGMWVTLAVGTAWLSGFVGLSTAITLGMQPFVATGIIKTLLLAGFLKASSVRL